MNSSVHLFKYEEIGPEILQISKIEQKIASLVM